MPPKKKGQSVTKEQQPGAGATTAEVEVVCSICTETITDAAELPCAHGFCHTCITQSLSHNGPGRGKCPLCRKAAKVSDVQRNRILERLAANVEGTCTHASHGCAYKGRRDALREHEKDCPKRPGAAEIAALRAEYEGKLAAKNRLLDTMENENRAKDRTIQIQASHLTVNDKLIADQASTLSSKDELIQIQASSLRAQDKLIADQARWAAEDEPGARRGPRSEADVLGLAVQAGPTWTVLGLGDEFADIDDMVPDTAALDADDGPGLGYGGFDEPAEFAEVPGPGPGAVTIITNDPTTQAGGATAFNVDRSGAEAMLLASHEAMLFSDAPPLDGGVAAEPAGTQGDHAEEDALMDAYAAEMAEMMSGETAAADDGTAADTTLFANESTAVAEPPAPTADQEAQGASS